MIEFKDVSFSFDNSPVLNEVNFCIKEGEFVGILGPNGGGKSTFLRLALGLLKPSKGYINRDFKTVRYIAQTTSLSDASFPATVEEVVSLGLVDSKISPFSKSRKIKTEEILKKMDLWQFRKRLVNELSGGQMQRVKIAKALIANPDLLVLDEPDAGMDEEAHHHLIEAVDEFHRKGKAVLFVSHHPEDLHHTEAIYFIEGGRLLTYEQEKERGHHHVNL